MDMTVPVTLIVKAPNQQIDDQTVKCELSWTIQKLKYHLSEVYPSKPAKEEQKLIYSGQLLSDTVVLKDVLRNYDGQNTHTVHLVCTPSQNYKFEGPKAVRMEQIAPQNQQAPIQQQQQQQLPQAQPVVVDIPNTTGLRQRTVTVNNSTSTHELMTDMRNMWTNLSQPYGAFPNLTNPSQYAVQAAMFQQAYAQYINQYMQMMNQIPPLATNADIDSDTAAGQNVAAPAAQNEQADVPVAAADDPENDEMQQDRDWLDWFYVLSRVLVLLCIVYFYSSPLRFAFVLFLGIGLYLYQIGFYRVNNNENRRPENNNLPPANQQNIIGEEVILPVAEQRPTMLNIMWTFFTTFFTSLIPEIPHAV